MAWRTVRRSRWCSLSDPARTDGGTVWGMRA